MSNDDNVELIPAERRIQYLSECLDLKDEAIEIKDKQLKILMDEIEIKQTQINIYKDIERRSEITINQQNSIISKKEILVDPSTINFIWKAGSFVVGVLIGIKIFIWIIYR